MTITLPPQIETRLRRRAALTGVDADALAGILLLGALDEGPERTLRAEYRQLAALKLSGRITPAQADRLRVVTGELDDLDADSPEAQAMSSRLDETGHKLDEMLALLRTMPFADQTA